MKRLSVYFLSVFVLLSTFQAIAAEEVHYITSYGSAYGYCDGYNSHFCVRDLERRAADEGERDADRQCWSLKGRLEFGSISNCNLFSSPSYIPPQGQTWVSVSANCQYRCYVNVEADETNQTKE